MVGRFYDLSHGGICTHQKPLHLSVFLVSSLPSTSSLKGVTILSASYSGALWLYITSSRRPAQLNATAGLHN
jgi:hypothetical protein